MLNLYPATDSRLRGACRPHGRTGDGRAHAPWLRRGSRGSRICSWRPRRWSQWGSFSLCCGPSACWRATPARIAQGNLEHRVEWSSRDSFGVIAGELNRIAVRLRELRDTEAGRRQMEFQLSDAVLQSIFEPIIVTDGKGHVLKVNQAAAELLGEAAADRMALANSARRRQDSERHPRCRLHAEGGGRRGRSLAAADAHRQAGAQLPSAHHAHARLRGAAAGHGDHARRRDQPAGHRPLQDAVHQRGQPQAARPAAAVAPRPLRSGAGLRRRIAPLAGGTGGRGQQREREAGRSDGRPDRSGRTGRRPPRVHAGSACARCRP